MNDQQPQRTPTEHKRRKAELQVLLDVVVKTDGDQRSPSISDYGVEHSLYLSVYVSVEGAPKGRFLHVEHDAVGTMRVSSLHHMRGQPLRDADHLLEILRATREKVLKSKVEHQKKQKIRGLQVRAIDGMVAELARAHGFAYVIEDMEGKSVLRIRMDNRYGLEVDIPHKAAREVLALVPALFKQVAALYAHGGARVLVAHENYGARRAKPWQNLAKDAPA